MDPRIGTRVSHYSILRQLGRGGMGVVYEAEDSSLGRKVALKFLPAELVQDAQSLERFQREARAASALNHPGICTVFAIERHEGQPFIAMELLEGQTLAQTMAAGRPLEMKQILELGIQIADALESAHAKSIVHRDIKPANVFVTPRGHVKILDFGLAKVDAPRRAAAAGASQMDTVAGREELTTPGTTLGTVSYMSPEQARGQMTDARTDLFSMGTMLYQMATGIVPFPGDTSAVIYDAILNRDPAPAGQVNGALPAELGRILDKALEKDRNLRYQTATELKTDLMRLKRDMDSGGRRAAAGDSRSGDGERPAEKSVAVLYFESLSGAKEDEYFRDGITEDIITELSKIKGLRVFPRPTVLPYRDKSITPQQVGRELNASFVLGGSLRRAGNRLRINAQLMDARADFPLWSERYDREMEDVFEVQDEIARKIAEALRVTLSPQEQEALAAKPTEDLLAYDLFLRGKSYARRLTRQDLEFALQMFDKAVGLDPNFALAHAAIANACAWIHHHYERDARWIGRAVASSQRAVALKPDLPEAQITQAWILYTGGQYDAAVRCMEQAIAQKPDCEGGYYLLARSLFALGRYQDVVDIAEAALDVAGEDYNVFVPVLNSLGALGKNEMLKNLRQRKIATLEGHLLRVPDDARARILLAKDYAAIERVDDSTREAGMAVALRPNEAMVLYNAACVFSVLGKRKESLETLTKAWNAGFREIDWVRRDPDLTPLRGDPDFERMYPEGAEKA